MADIIEIKATEYRCGPCSQEHGEDIRALVRMIPFSVVFMGKLIGSEAWCCPLCRQPKFDVKTRRPVMNEKATVSKPPRAKRSGKDTGASVTPLHSKAANV